MLVIYFVNYFIAKQGDEQWLITDGYADVPFQEQYPEVFL